MFKRKTHGEFKLTSEFSDEKFKNYFRMTRNDFKEVHAMIASDLEDQGYGGHERISTEEKLAVFLRFVASGNSYRSIAYSYRMGERTISNIITKVSSAIWKNMRPIHLPEPTLDIWVKMPLISKIYGKCLILWALSMENM